MKNVLDVIIYRHPVPVSTFYVFMCRVLVNSFTKNDVYVDTNMYCSLSVCLSVCLYIYIYIYIFSPTSQDNVNNYCGYLHPNERFNEDILLDKTI